MKGLKICFIAGTLGVGGAERQLFHILRTLHEKGADVSLISVHTGEYWEDKIKQTGIKYFTLEGKGNSLQRLFKIISIIKSIKPDIIQSQHFYTNLYAALAARVIGLPSIGASRNQLSGEIEANGFLGRYCFSLPKYFIANSQESVQQAIALKKGKSETIFYLPNALDFSRMKPVLADRYDSSKVLLSVGRAVPQKRLERFVRLVSDLKQRGHDVKGLHLGDGPQLDELKTIAHDLGLSDEDMVFKGRVSDPETYYASSDALVLTSDYEGTPNVVLEAMASQLPVIVPEVGNIPYFIQDGRNGLLFDKDSSDSLLRQAETLINDPALAQNIGVSGRSSALDLFSIEHLGSNLYDIYKRIASQEGIPFE